jgi:hypothetical protein
VENALKRCMITLILMFGGTNDYAQCTFGPELVSNGGFECTSTCSSPHMTPTEATSSGLDKVSLGSQYNYRSASQWCTGSGGGSPTNSLGAGNYIITSNPVQCCDCQNATGATTNSGMYAMLVDGGTSGLNVWCQTIPVVSGTTYSFTAWYKNPGANTTVPSLSMTVNGVSISGMAEVSLGTSFIEAGCFWQASSSSNVTICIQVSSNGSSSGNDMLLDDISFRPVTAGPGCSATAGICTYNGTDISLPVEFISFSAQQISSDQVMLQWETVMEENLSHFTVLKSYDAHNFYEVGRIEAKGNSNYEYIDPNFNQSSYYKLTAVDHDGAEKSSVIQYVTTDKNKLWIVNTSEEFEIHTLAEGNTTYQLVLYSLLGQQELNLVMEVKKGEYLIYKRRKKNEFTPGICRITNAVGEIVFSELLTW